MSGIFEEAADVDKAEDADQGEDSEERWIDEDCVDKPGKEMVAIVDVAPHPIVGVKPSLTGWPAQLPAESLAGLVRPLRVAFLDLAPSILVKLLAEQLRLMLERGTVVAPSDPGSGGITSIVSVLNSLSLGRPR